MKKIGTCSIQIPDSLYQTLSIRIPALEYRFPINEYPETTIDFLELINSKLNETDFCLQNPEYHAPRLWGIIPAKVTGVLCYADEESKGFFGDIKWGDWRIIDWTKKAQIA